MERFRPRSRRLAALAALALAVAFAAVAVADVTVYKNDFSKKEEYKDVKASGGKHCDRSYRKHDEVFRAVVEKAPESCAYKPPVQGSGSQPDHRFQAQGKVLSSTGKSARKKAYLSISVRVGGGDRYELRVFPKTQEYQLKREPTGSGFPVDGSSSQIKGIGERNELRLQAYGNDVKALVNGNEVASVNDGNVGQVDGAKVEFGLGNTGSSKKDTEGTFDKLKLAVPNP